MGLRVFIDDPELPDEIRYERVDYLYALFIYTHLGSIVAEDVKGIVTDVVDAVSRSGQRLAKEERLLADVPMARPSLRHVKMAKKYFKSFFQFH